MFLLPGNAVNRAAPLNRGLVGWYKHLPNRMAGGGSYFTNLLLRDNLTLNGSPVWSGNRPRGGFGSISLNGSSQYMVTAANATAFNLTTYITAAAWVYPTAIASTRHYVFDYQSLAGTGWSTEILDSTGFKMRFTVAGVATYDTAAGVITTNAWQHLVWVFDTNANTVTFYVNGARVAQSTSVGDITSVSNPFGLGRRNAHGDRFFSGYIDDARVSSVAFSDAQIAALYKASCLGYLTELNWQRYPVYGPEQAAATFNPAWAINSNAYIHLGA